MTWIMSTSTADTWWGASCRRVLTVVGIAWAVTGLLAFPAHAQFVDPLTIVPVLASSIQQPPLANSIADDVVQTFLQKLILKKDGTIDESFVKRLGFVSSSEIINPSALTSAQPFAVFNVGLDALKKYTLNLGLIAVPSGIPLGVQSAYLLGEDANWFQLGPTRFLTPIVTETTVPEVRSSLLVSLLPVNGSTLKDWQIQQIGHPYLIQRLTDPMTGGNGKKHFVISIPAMNRWFLGRIDDPKFDPPGTLVAGTFKIKVIIDDPDITMSAGQEDTADNVFKKLESIANKIVTNGPPN